MAPRDKKRREGAWELGSKSVGNLRLRGRSQNLASAPLSAIGNDKKNVRAFRKIFARSADESQEELANAVASGAARALKNAISPVVEHTSRKSSNTADIARQLFVAPSIVNPSDNTTDNPDGKEDEACSNAIPDVFEVTCDLELPNDAVVREVDLTQDMRRCLQEIKQEGDLKVALHSDEILFLNNILILHNDQEPGPIVKRSGLYANLMKLGKEHDTEEYQLPGQDQLDLLAVARKIAQLPATIRPADVIFPAYKLEAADYNRGLEILYAFASHVQTAPSSSREADFTVHYVVSMLSALQGPGQNFAYDTLSAHVKTRRPDVALNIDGKEIFICEITSQKRANDKKKVSLDFIRLGRFMKAAVNNGVSKPIGVIVAGMPV
ncbi:hypothetical protein BGX20_000339 [Mortierella sp. AD010]|nr:hypothetical protein BGX20_000339 [Mortierella sp. AD010]